MESQNWQPSASIATLIARTKIIQQIREFFADRCVLEVETPILSYAAVTDIHLCSFETQYLAPGSLGNNHSGKFSLTTSPEFHMKRLLVAGSGPIYQMIKCFRNEDMGRYHNPEFTMLEWYRTQFDMMQIIQEVDDLLQIVLDCESAELVSYQNIFMRHLELDPLEASRTQLIEAANKLNLGFDTEGSDNDTILQFLFGFGVEPHIGKQRPIVVYHFPASQAALAEISSEDNRVAKRFEVYYKGVELVNGFKELTNAAEQRRRFEADNKERIARNLPPQTIDENFLAALEKGLPDCSGVALGLDRLIMIALGAEKLSDVMAFSADRA